MSQPEEQLVLALAGARVACAVTDRVRVRLATRPPAERLTAVAEVLASWPGVLAVQPRPTTGSLVLRCERGAPVDALLEALEAAGVGADGGAASGSPSAATRIKAAAVTVDRATVRATGGHDLRLLVPMSFAVLSLRQLRRGDQRLRDAPWYLLGWYAFESFTKLQQP